MDVSIEIVQKIINMTEAVVDVKEERAETERDSRNLLGLFPVFLIMLMVVLRVSWTLYKSFGKLMKSFTYFALIMLSCLIETFRYSIRS